MILERNKDGAEIKSRLHAFGDIPIVEYPNNQDRISDIELVIDILDAINNMQSNRMDAIEQFLPALDSFKMATNMITDKNTLMGIQFIEKGILDTLKKMGVEEIDATGEFNPDLHQAIDTDSSADVESGHIVKVAYKGFTYHGKVIRYSQVIVKK